MYINMHIPSFFLNTSVSVRHYQPKSEIAQSIVGQTFYLPSVIRRHESRSEFNSQWGHKFSEFFLQTVIQ